MNGYTMLEIQIPGYKQLRLRHLVLDFNGTLALDGVLIPGTEERLIRLSKLLDIHVITADTFGGARDATRKLPVSLSILAEPDQAGAKASFVDALRAERCAAIGNGRNDYRMLQAAELGIAVIQGEGAAQAAIAAADLVFTSINDALDALLSPARLVAGLRR